MIDAHPMTFGLISLAAALLVLFLFYKLLMNSMAREEPKTASRASSDDIASLEQALGGPLPPQLRNAYLEGSILQFRLPAIINRPALTESYLDAGDECVAEFYAATAASNRISITNAELPATAFVLARDDFGNLFYLCTDKESVYYWDHDSDGNGFMIFKSFVNFWKALQAASPRHNPCPHCSYDLRAHKPGDKCPESGTTILGGPAPAKP